MLLITQSLNLLAPPSGGSIGAGGGAPTEAKRERNLADVDRFLASEFHKSRQRENLLIMLQTGDIDETEYLLFMQMLE